MLGILRFLIVLSCSWQFVEHCGRAAEAKPNFLWITSEDHGTQLGCYGDAFATTPNIDALAKRGLRYTRCWANAPVCAPSRTTLITGMYATSTGGEHMRSMVAAPEGKPFFPQLLRQAGYYCSNNVKEDYNLAESGQVWDDSSRNAHWKNAPPERPFFAVFNSNRSHESQLRKRPHQAVHEPAKVRVPAYHPDTPEVRQDWAQYYDTVSEADADAGRRLAELVASDRAENTIVFYFSDHGSGMPRSKRWPYDSGLHVPLVVYIPEKFAHLRPADYQAGGATDRLVSLVDFGPTMLSLAGIRPGAWMQGVAFLGPHAAPPRHFVFGFRGRMDERIDLVRSASDGRFVYVRNFMPHRIQGQHLNYMFQTPTTQIWKRLHDAGKLNAEQDAFWRPKPPEELYDLTKDPDEVHNLAADPMYQDDLERLRAAQHELALYTRDVGFLPEAEMHARSGDRSPYDMALDAGSYPSDRVIITAELAAGLKAEDTPLLIKYFEDVDSGVRYWGAMGLLMRGSDAVRQGAGSLRANLADPSPSVRIVCAEALARYGEPSDRALAMKVLADHASLSENDVFTSIAALNALDATGTDVGPIKAALRGQAPGKASHPRYADYVPRLLQPRKE